LPLTVRYSASLRPLPLRSTLFPYTTLFRSISMLRKIAKESMGKADYGWLKSQFHFSFAEYYRPDNIQFGVLRVVNDDLVQPGTGDRKSTRLNSSHVKISYAVFCLKKKNYTY